MPASSRPAASPTPAITIHPTAGPPGTAVAITATNCPPPPEEPGGEDGRFEDSDHTAHGPATDFAVKPGASGTAHGLFTIPPTAAPGAALMEVVCAGPGNAVAHFEVETK